MLNLIGEIPDSGKILDVEGSHLHLYGKEARPGRKLGHVTVRSDDPEVLEAGCQSGRGPDCRVRRAATSRHHTPDADARHMTGIPTHGETWFRLRAVA